MSMTYREIALNMLDDDSEEVLWDVGQWMGNEGGRAVDFPDAGPLDFDPENERDWVVRLREYFDEVCRPLHVPRDPESLRRLINAGVDVKALGGCFEDTPLHHQGHPKSVELLLNAGADVDARDFKGNTPLHFQGNPKSVELLINAGADVNVRDHNRFTPLDSWRSNSEIVRVLFAHGAKDTNNDIRNSSHKKLAQP